MPVEVLRHFRTPAGIPQDITFGACEAQGKLPAPRAFPVTVSNRWNVKVNDVLLVPAQDTSKHYLPPLPILFQESDYTLQL